MRIGAKAMAVVYDRYVLTNAAPTRCSSSLPNEFSYLFAQKKTHAEADHRNKASAMADVFVR
jgi:hypothetical protein